LDDQHDAKSIKASQPLFRIVKFFISS